MTTKTLTLTIAAALTALAACDSSGGEPIGPEGGVVSSRDGRFELDIAPGALTDTVDVTIEYVENCVGFSGCYEIGPVGTILDIPARVTYFYTDDARSLTNGDGVSLELEQDYGWRPLADREVDTELELVSGTIGFFTNVVVADRG